MKQVGLYIFVISIIGGIFAGPAFAQIDADVTFSVPVPTNDFADYADQGYGAGADLFVGLPLLPIKLGGHVGYNSFKEADNAGGGDTTVIEMLPSIRYQLGLPLDILSFWAQFGAGIYRWENDSADDTDFGVSFGAGVSAMVLPGLKVMAMPMYHIIMAEDENLTYVSANVGLRF